MPIERKKTTNSVDASHGRLNRNRRNPSSRFLAEDGDRVGQERAGIEGERKLADYLLQPHDTILSGKRNKGWNLQLPDGRTINVITSRKDPLWLPVEVGHVHADIFVQCHWDQDKNRVRLIGWATKQEVLDAPIRQLITGGPNNHAIYFTGLRPMDELRDQVVPKTLKLF